MMSGRHALLFAFVLLALPLLAYAQAACAGGFANGICEPGDTCQCTDCWGLNPPTTVDVLNRPTQYLCGCAKYDSRGGDWVCIKPSNDICMKDSATGLHACGAPSVWYKGEVERVAGSWQVWGPVASFAVLVAFLVVALAYMIGIAFDLSPLRMWAKSEMYQAFASALLVGSLVVLVHIATDQGLALILGQAINPFALAYGYLLPLADQLMALYQTNYEMAFPLETLASMSVYNNAGSGSDKYIFAFLKPLSIEPLHLMNYYILQGMVTVWFQVELLNFFQSAAFGTFLPLGIILRIFPFTRGTGGLLIAMAIAFYFIYPIMFGFISMMSDDETTLRAAMSGDDAGLGIDPALYNACDHDLGGAASVADAQTDPVVLSKVNERYSFLPPVVMKVMFYPLIVFAVTFTFIKMASPLLGSDISDVGQGLVKLI